MPTTVPIDGGHGGGGDFSGGPPGPPPPSTTKPPSVQRLTLGLNPEDAADLRSDYVTLHEAKQLYGYARERNEPIRTEFDVMCDFALGKQFLTWGNELDHQARPRRNITWDTIRHKRGLVTEPPVSVEVLPRGQDDGGKAQLAKAALDLNAERVERRDKVDHSVAWASMVGTGIVHQGWDPFTGQTCERVVDPRLFDPDPDHITPETWGYVFETLRMPLEQARVLFPATGDDLVPDNVADAQKGSKSAWQPASTGAAVAMKVGSGQANASEADGPEFVTIVLYYSRGHFAAADDKSKVMLRCKLCSGTFASDAPALDVVSNATPAPPDEVCPACGYGQLERVLEENGKLVPSYPSGRRLVAFAPASDVLLYKGPWPTEELLDWPYKAMRWYTDPRRWWGLGEPAFQWSLQLLANKMLVLLAENATANAAPKVILPKGIGFEKRPWNNIPSEKLIADDPRLIQFVKAFQTGDVGQSLVFLTGFAMRELKAQGGFDDLALGQIKGNTEISGVAIEQAKSASEVPVRDHLRERYKMETRLFRDDLQMIRTRWSSERLVRLDNGFEVEVHWLKGKDLPELDVIVTSDPVSLIERKQRVDLALKLLDKPDPATGEPVLDAQAVAEWVGVPTRILRGVRARRLQRGPTPEAPAPLGAAGAAPGMGGMDQIAALLSQPGIGAGAGPQFGG